MPTPSEILKKAIDRHDAGPTALERLEKAIADSHRIDYFLEKALMRVQRLVHKPGKKPHWQGFWVESGGKKVMPKGILDRPKYAKKPSSKSKLETSVSAHQKEFLEGLAESRRNPGPAAKAMMDHAISASVESFSKHLPELQGSEKQVPWASDLRNNLVKDFVRYMMLDADEPQPLPRESVNSLYTEANRALSETSAKNWINSRHENRLRDIAAKARKIVRT